MNFASYHVQLSQSLRIVEKATNFDDLKSKLLQYTKERRAFLKGVDDKWNTDTPENWGFPSNSMVLPT